MSRTVLIVDDSDTIRLKVGEALLRAGFEVLVAEDGVDALEKLDGRAVHLIISDVNMPRMDGITLIKEVKKLARYQFVPVCMLTTESSVDRMREGGSVGVKAWLVKPFRPPQLLEVVSRLVLLKQEAEGVGMAQREK